MTSNAMLAFVTFARWKKARRTMCMALSVALLSQGFVSCSGVKFLGMGRGKKYLYGYTMVAPVKSARMVFQDDSMKIQFRIDGSALCFQLQNLTHSTMTVQWGKVSIGVDRRYSWTRHLADMYTDTVRVLTSIPIPPLGYIQDLVIPSDNITYAENQWVETDLFPTADGSSTAKAQAIRKNVGKSIVLTMPLMFGKVSREYRFEFKVVSVRQVSWSDYRPPKRNLPPPKKAPVQGADNITTAIIVVGLLGFVALMVSLKKSPVAE